MTQKLKKGIEENWRIQELVAELITMEDHYLLIELFAGCARLSRMAKNREGWVAEGQEDTERSALLDSAPQAGLGDYEP